MKYVLVDKFDNIVHTVDLNEKYTEEEAKLYFINLKQIDEWWKEEDSFLDGDKS